MCVCVCVCVCVCACEREREREYRKRDRYQSVIYNLKEISLYTPAGESIAAGAGANFVPSCLAGKEFDPSTHKT